jgi:thiol-disulfide isomerase/thioredoxin
LKKILLLLPFLVLAAPLRAIPAPAANPASTQNLASYKTADTLWKHLTDLVDHASHVQSERVESDRQITATAQAFMKQYPADARTPNARLLWAQSGEEMVKMKLPDAPPALKVAQAFDELLHDPAVPKGERGEIRAFQIADAIKETAQGGTGTAAAWNSIDDSIGKFQKDFGADFSLDGHVPVAMELRAVELHGLQQAGNQDLYRAELEKLSSDPEPEIAQFATEKLAMDKALDAYKGKPFELKFTSAAGKPVDVAQLRGKVVLVDFWATWCGPCVAEVPNVVAAYQKYHAQGFDIVGVSLDQDKDAMLAFTKAHEMTWPQFFDGNGFENNAVSSKLGIQMIPTMWLIDQQGRLVESTDGDDLADQVGKHKS